jgi:hypothetical protein
MLILFDQGTPVAIRGVLPEHTVRTAASKVGALYSTANSSEPPNKRDSKYF